MNKSQKGSLNQEKASYLKEKTKNGESIIRNTVGGAKNFSFSVEMEEKIHNELYRLWDTNKLERYSFFAEKLNEIFQQELSGLQKSISVSYIRSIFKAWGFSFKNSYAVHKNKKEASNVEYYNKYIEEIKDVPKATLLFQDESSFHTRDFKTTKFHGPKGQQMYYEDNLGTNDRYCASVLIAIRNDKSHAIYFQLRQDSNTAIDFAFFFLEHLIIILSNQETQSSSITLLLILKSLSPNMSILFLIKFK